MSGALAVAQPQPWRRVNIHTAAWRPDHPGMASRHNELGIVLQNLGALARAPTHLEQALELSQATLDPDHPNVAILRGNLDSVGQRLLVSSAEVLGN
jgi:hypothetical protein